MTVLVASPKSNFIIIILILYYSIPDYQLFVCKCSSLTQYNIKQHIHFLDIASIHPSYCNVVNERSWYLAYG